jgi:hypothetical protein
VTKEPSSQIIASADNNGFPVVLHHFKKPTEAFNRNEGLRLQNAHCTTKKNHTQNHHRHHNNKNAKRRRMHLFSPYIHNEETIRAQTTDENRFQKLVCNILLALKKLAL